MEPAMEDLGAWGPAVKNLRSSTSEELLALRISNFERAAGQGRDGPGGTWTQAVVDAIVEAARPDVAWPMRPPRGSLPPGPTFAASSQPEAPSQEWRWLQIQMPWLGVDGQEHTTLAVAVLFATRGSQTDALLSATALWRVFPTADPVASFCRSSKTAFWECMAKLGVTMDDDLVPSSLAKSLMPEARSGLAARIQANAFLVTPRLLWGSLACPSVVGC